VHNNRASLSPLSGSAQTISLPGMRWGVSLDFAEQNYAERAALEGWLSRLSGQEHRAALWDLARPSPSLLSGAPLVNGALAQFATTLNLDGVIGCGANLLGYSQSMDNAVWAKPVVTVTADAVAAPDGTMTADLITRSGSANLSLWSDFLQNVTVGAGANVGRSYTGSIWLRSQTGTVNMNLAISDVNFNTYSGGNIALSTTWQRYSFMASGGAGWNASGTQIGLGMVIALNSAVYAWGAQLEVGSAMSAYNGLPSLTPGDWLGLPLSAGGSQLVQVVNTTVGETLTGVEYRPMLRGAVADNAVITINRPTANFILAQPELVVPRAGANRCPAFSADLIEVFS
jgi:hypothetical protein